MFLIDVELRLKIINAYTDENVKVAAHYPNFKMINENNLEH